jgi:hypothetical protein
VLAFLGGSSTLVIEGLLPAGDTGQAPVADPAGHEPIAALRPQGGGVRPPRADLAGLGVRSPARQVVTKGQLELGFEQDGVEYRLVDGQLLQVQPDGRLAPVDPASLDADHSTRTPLVQAVPPADSDQATATNQGELPATGSRQTPLTPTIETAVEPAPPPTGEQHSHAQPPPADLGTPGSNLAVGLFDDTALGSDATPTAGVSPSGTGVSDSQAMPGFGSDG